MQGTWQLVNKRTKWHKGSRFLQGSYHAGTYRCWIKLGETPTWWLPENSPILEMVQFLSRIRGFLTSTGTGRSQEFSENSRHQILFLSSLLQKLPPIWIFARGSQYSVFRCWTTRFTGSCAGVDPRQVPPRRTSDGTGPSDSRAPGHGVHQTRP